MAVPFSNTRLRVPKGFQNVLEGLAREVLRCQPENIYSFAADYFEELLRKRQETGYDDITLLGAKLEDRFYNNHSFKNPNTNTNNEEQQTAAVKIQSEYRRFAAKKEVDSKKEEEAAIVIQASVRGHLERQTHKSNSNDDTDEIPSTEQTNEHPHPDMEENSMLHQKIDEQHHEVVEEDKSEDHPIVQDENQNNQEYNLEDTQKVLEESMITTEENAEEIHIVNENSDQNIKDENPEESQILDETHHDDAGDENFEDYEHGELQETIEITEKEKENYEVNTNQEVTNEEIADITDNIPVENVTEQISDDVEESQIDNKESDINADVEVQESTDFFKSEGDEITNDAEDVTRGNNEDILNTDRITERSLENNEDVEMSLEVNEYDKIDGEEKHDDEEEKHDDEEEKHDNEEEKHDNEEEKHDNEEEKHDNEEEKHDNEEEKHDNEEEKHDNKEEKHDDEEEKHGNEEELGADTDRYLEEDIDEKLEEQQLENAFEVKESFSDLFATENENEDHSEVKDDLNIVLEEDTEKVQDTTIALDNEANDDEVEIHEEETLNETAAEAVDTERTIDITNDLEDTMVDHQESNQDMTNPDQEDNIQESVLADDVDNAETSRTEADE